MGKYTRVSLDGGAELTTKLCRYWLPQNGSAFGGFEGQRQPLLVHFSRDPLPFALRPMRRVLALHHLHPG